MYTCPATFRHHLKIHLFQLAFQSPYSFLLAPQIQPPLTIVCVYKVYFLTYLITIAPALQVLASCTCTVDDALVQLGGLTFCDRLCDMLIYLLLSRTLLHVTK